MRAGKLPIQAISGTMGVMDSAAKIMKGLGRRGSGGGGRGGEGRGIASAPKPPESTSPNRTGWLRPSRLVSRWSPDASPALIPATTPYSLTSSRVSWPRPPSASRHAALRASSSDGIGPLAAISLVVGSMIGSGIFIVSADIGRQVGAWGPGALLVVWVVTGLMTVTGRAGLRRAGGDDAQGGRPVRLPARGALAARRASSTAGPSSPSSRPAPSPRWRWRSRKFLSVLVPGRQHRTSSCRSATCTCPARRRSSSASRHQRLVAIGVDARAHLASTRAA